MVSRDRKTDIESAMTPMIDVVFLLLVFFVWTSSFQMIEQILPSQMSTQMGTETSEINAPPPEKDFDDVVIRILWNGQSPTWSINDQPIDSIASMRQRLSAIASVKVDAPVILHPDGEVPLGDVIQVYDVSKLAGFEKIAFAVNPESL
jgi:biopolymer transport protein ExbD